MKPTGKTLTLTTDMAADLAHMRPTFDAVQSAARAWERAAVLIGKAAGFDVEADAAASAVEAHRGTCANESELSHLDRDVMVEWVASVWQAAHDAIYTKERPSRFHVSAKVCKDAGVKLRARYDRLPPQE